MNTDTWIGKKGFRYWYYRFRDSEYYGLAIIAFTLLVSVILLFSIIIPEVTQWFSIRNEVIAARQEIATLQQNITFVNNLDKNSLDSQLMTVSHALPTEKDFGNMLSTISNAAAVSGVSLSNYEFQVGNIASTKSKQISALQKDGLFTIEITLIANGNNTTIRNFIKTLENSLPLAEITNLNGTGENVSVRLTFYQKPFSDVSFSADTPLEALSPTKIRLIQKLAKWDNTGNTQGLPAFSSSNSAVPLF
jgi:hypothetical protein